MTDVVRAIRDAVTDPETYRDILVLGLTGLAAVVVLAIYAHAPL